jgi:predicted porin
MFRTLVSATAALLLAQPLMAQSVAVTGGLELEFVLDEHDSGQALIGYVEAESNGFYGGVWAQVANESLFNEVDLYLGYRAERGQLSYDIYYTRYFFPDDGGDCCGDVTLELAYALTPQVSVGTELAYDPQNELGSAYLLADFALTDQIGLSAQYGFYDTGADKAAEWEIGASYALTDATAVSLTYLDGEEYDPYLKLNLTWDFDLFSR